VIKEPRGMTEKHIYVAPLLQPLVSWLPPKAIYWHKIYWPL